MDTSFIERCLDGTARAEEIDQYIEDWHEGRGGTGQNLHDYLGMTWAEYSLWATTPSALSSILLKRKLAGETPE